MPDLDPPAVPETAPCKLEIRSGRLHVQLPDDDTFHPASIVYLRPLSSRSEVGFFDDDSKEILSIESIDQLAPACRTLAKSELAARYHLPQVSRVKSIKTVFGTHYWTVDTDKGPCEFAFKEPGKNVTYLSDSHIILRDTIGNRYEIESLTQLDAQSKRQVNKIL